MRHILAIILLLSVGMSAKAQQIYSLTTEEICLDSTQIFVNYYNGFGKNGVPFQEVHSYMDVTGTQIYPDTSQLNTDCLGAPDGSLDSLTIDFIGCGRDTIIIMDTTIVIRYDTNIWLCDTLPCEADFWTIGDTTYLIDNQCDTTKICLGGGLDSLTIDFIGCNRDTIIVIDTTIVIRNDTNVWVCDSLMNLEIRQDSIICIELSSGQEYCDTLSFPEPCQLESYLNLSQDTFYHYDSDCDLVIVPLTQYPSQDTSYVINDSTIVIVNVDGSSDTLTILGDEYIPCPNESYIAADTFYHIDSDCDTLAVPLTQYPSQDTSYVINDSTIVIVNVDGSSDTLTILGDEYIPCPNESYIAADTFYHIDSDCDTLAVPLTTPCIDSTWYGAWNHQEDTLFHRNILCELDTIIRENHSCFYVCDNGDSIRVETSVDISVIPPVIVIDTIKRWGLVCDTLGFGNMLTVHIDGHGKPQIDLGGPAAHPGNQEHTTVIQHNDFQMNWINENQVYLTTRRNLCTLFPELECDSLSYAMYSVNNSNGEGNTSVVAVSEGCTYTYSSLSSDPTFVSGIITCSDKLEIRGDAGICFTSDQDSVFMTVDSHFVLQRKPDWIMGFVADATKIWADTSTFGVPPPGCDDDGIYAVRYNFDSLLNDVAGAIPQPECDSMFFEGTTGGKWANHCDTIKFISGTGTDSIDVRSGSIIIDINTIYNEESVTGTGTDPTLAMCAAITGPPGTLGTFTDASGGYWVVRKNTDGTCTTLEMPQDSSCYIESDVFVIRNLKNQGNLNAGCTYCFTRNFGSCLAEVTVCVVAMAPDQLAQNVSVKRGNEIYWGRYDFNNGSAGWEEIRDNRLNVVIGNGPILRFPWGDTDANRNHVEQNANFFCDCDLQYNHNDNRHYSGSTYDSRGKVAGYTYDSEFHNSHRVDDRGAGTRLIQGYNFYGSGQTVIANHPNVRLFNSYTYGFQFVTGGTEHFVDRFPINPQSTLRTIDGAARYYYGRGISGASNITISNGSMISFYSSYSERTNITHDATGIHQDYDQTYERATVKNNGTSNNYNYYGAMRSLSEETITDTYVYDYACEFSGRTIRNISNFGRVNSFLENYRSGSTMTLTTGVGTSIFSRNNLESSIIEGLDKTGSYRIYNSNILGNSIVRSSGGGANYLYRLFLSQNSQQYYTQGTSYDNTTMSNAQINAENGAFTARFSNIFGNYTRVLTANVINQFQSALGSTAW